MIYNIVFIIAFLCFFYMQLCLSYLYYKKKNIKQKRKFWIIFVLFDIGLSVVAALVVIGVMYLCIFVIKVIWGM